MARHTPRGPHIEQDHPAAKIGESKVMPLLVLKADLGHLARLIENRKLEGVRRRRLLDDALRRNILPLVRKAQNDQYGRGYGDCCPNRQSGHQPVSAGARHHC